MSSWGKVASSVLVQYVGRVLGLGISLISTIFLTRTLGVSGYGEYTTAIAIAGLVMVFSDLGFFWSTIRNLSESGEKRTVANQISGIRVAVMLGLIALAMAIVWGSGYELAIKQAFTILGIFILSSGLNNVMVAVHQSDYAMGWPTIADVLGRLTNLFLIIIGRALGKDLPWFVIAVSLSATVNLLVNWFVLNRRYGFISPKIFGFSWARYYKSVLMLGIVTLFGSLYIRVDVIVLSAFKTSVDVGIYGAAGKVVEIGMVFQALFMAAVFPLMLEKFRQGKEQFSRAIADGFFIVTAIGLPLSLILATLSTGLIRFIAGSKFVDASTVAFSGHPIATPLVLAILSGYVFLAHLDTVFTVGLIAADRLKYLLGVNIIAFVVNLVLNLILVSHYSYLAAALITVLTEIIVATLNIGKISREYRPPIAFGSIIRIIIATFVILPILLWPVTIHIVFRVILASFVYAGVLILLVPRTRQVFWQYLGKIRPGTAD